MNAAPSPPGRRGLELLVAHCSSVYSDAPTARERLEEALGPDLASKLVFALSSRPAGRERFAA
jgi:hypothetical protein